MSEHTPGPWGLAYYGKGVDLPIPFMEHKTVAVFSEGVKRGDVAYMQHGLWGDDQAYANARLIAAAPDLIKALCMTVLALADASEDSPEPYRYRPAFEAASAAIAKATGEKA